LHPTRTHRFPVSVTSLLAAVALVVTACSGGGDGAEADPSAGPSDAVVLEEGIAATVGETEITDDEVDEVYARRAEGSAIASELAREEASEPSPELLANVLTSLIRAEILTQAAADRDIQVTAEQMSEQREVLVESAGGKEQLDQALADANVSASEFETSIVEQAAIQAAISDELASEVSDEQVRAQFSEDPQGQYGEKVEVRHILTETEEEAQEALERIESGEEFSEVAKDMSKDPGSAEQGGELGAVAKGTTVPAFDEAAFEAEEGELVGPVQTDFGYHVLEVTGRVEGAEFAEVEDEIRLQLESTTKGQAFSEYISTFISDLGIKVSPRYGTWDAQSVAVVPPQPSEAPSAPQLPLPTELPSAAAPAPGTASEAPTG
jgi:parvulin-like peptidyl-prolyl isomerase